MIFQASGLRDWLLQRWTAIYLLVYFVFLAKAFYLQPATQAHLYWKEFFALLSVRLWTFSAIIAVLLHGWIGIWTICTDYLPQTKLRISILSLIILLLVWECFWAAQVLFGSAWNV